MSHLNEFRQLRDSNGTTALLALVNEFGGRKMFEYQIDVVSRVPASEEAASLRLFIPLLSRLQDRRALRNFLCFAEHVWELESEGTPLPRHAETVCHRGCPND